MRLRSSDQRPGLHEAPVDDVVYGDGRRSLRKEEPCRDARRKSGRGRKRGRPSKSSSSASSQRQPEVAYEPLQPPKLRRRHNRDIEVNQIEPKRTRQWTRKESLKNKDSLQPIADDNPSKPVFIEPIDVDYKRGTHKVRDFTSKMRNMKCVDFIEGKSPKSRGKNALDVVRKSDVLPSICGTMHVSPSKDMRNKSDNDAQGQLNDCSNPKLSLIKQENDTESVESNDVHLCLTDDEAKAEYRMFDFGEKGSSESDVEETSVMQENNSQIYKSKQSCSSSNPIGKITPKQLKAQDTQINLGTCNVGGQKSLSWRIRNTDPRVIDDEDHEEHESQELSHSVVSPQMMSEMNSSRKCQLRNERLARMKDNPRPATSEMHELSSEVDTPQTHTCDKCDQNFDKMFEWIRNIRNNCANLEVEIIRMKNKS